MKTDADLLTEYDYRFGGQVLQCFERRSTASKQRKRQRTTSGVQLLYCHYNYIRFQFMYHLIPFHTIPEHSNAGLIMFSETHLHSLEHNLLMRFTCVSLNEVHGIKIIR